MEIICAIICARYFLLMFFKEKKMSDGVFRRKKGYTVVQNMVAKDGTLSLRAKGLYLLIQANISMPDKDWYKSAFEKMCNEGSKSFDGAWKELKERGLLRKHVYKTEKNKFRTEYELMDEPNDEPHTYYYDKNGELSSTNLGKIDRPILGHTPKGEVPNGDIPEGYIPNGADNNINTNNINNRYINTEINNSSSSQDEESTSLGSRIEKQIRVKELCIENPNKKNEIEKVINLIKNALINKRSVLANGKYHDFDEVKNRFLKLSKEQIQSVINKIPIDKSHTKNLDNYILAMLFNEPPVRAKESYGPIVIPANRSKEKSDFCSMKKRNYDFDELLRIARVN